MENQPVIEPFTIIAHDVDTGSPNRMHKSDLPKQLGYKGGFVLGNGNFGQITRRFLAEFGPDWLTRNIVDIKFFKPTFEGDPLRITADPMPDTPHARAYTVRAHNADGVEVMRFDTWLPSPFPAPDPLSSLPTVEKEGKPASWSWDAIVLNQPFRYCALAPTREENDLWCRELGADNPIYSEGPNPPLHPTVITRCFAECTHKEFVSEAVVAIANRMTMYRMLRVGDRLDMITVPVEKFEKKGNCWIVLHAAARVNGEVAVESRQTKIVKMRGAG
jgi:hypothetical protein